MQNHAEKSLATDYAAALDWWRDAGVDHEFEDEPQKWLEDPEEKRKPPPPPAAMAEEVAREREPAIIRAKLPTELEAFQSWWVNPESPLPGGSQPRVAPRGAANAPIMVLTPMPEIDDRESLLNGVQGILIANIAKAIKIAPAEVYWASALPSHMPFPDWVDLRADGLGEAVKHHISLVKPQRILVFGSKLPTLLGSAADMPPEQLSEIEATATLATFAPDRLLDHPRQRARLWQRLLQWTASQ